MKKTRSVTICTSASFYKQAWKVKEDLENRGLRVWIPLTAKKMNKTRNYKVSMYKTWYKDPAKYARKAFLMHKHFEEIKKADAILVINLKKKGVEGYIGGNVLMEMGLAFYLKKSIYLWQEISKISPNYEEVVGMQPIVISENLGKILA